MDHNYGSGTYSLIHFLVIQRLYLIRSQIFEFDLPKPWYDMLVNNLCILEQRFWSNRGTDHS